MAGLQGQDRSPRAPVRERRNFDNLASELDFIGLGEVIGISGDGELTLKLGTDGGLTNTGGELFVEVQGVLDIDASGIFVNIGDGLENAAGDLAIALAADSGLEFNAGDLQLVAREGQFVVTTVKTGAYTAAWGELVRCDPSGGAFTVTLPAAASNAGRQIIVKNTTSSAAAITIDGNSAETIDGSTTVVLAAPYASLTLVSDGTNVMIV